MDEQTLERALSPRRVASALCSRWPTLHVYVASREALVEIRQRVVAIVGSIPQADEIEPFDPTDPLEPWELRVELPGLDLEGWEQLCEALADAELELTHGMTPGVREARDLGRLVPDWIGDHAVSWCRADEGVARIPDVVVESPGPELVDLERALAHSLREVDSGLQFASSRGGDTVECIRHRTGGQRGLRIVLGHTAEHLGPEQRAAVVEAVQGVLAAEEGFRPELEWDQRYGLTLWAWRDAPGQPVRHALPLAEGLQPRASDCARLLRGLGQLAEEVEIQVVPTSAEMHDAVVASVVALAEASGLPIRGTRPCWVDFERSPRFAPCWAAAPVEGLQEWLEAVERVAEVAAVRVVPGALEGLEITWPSIDRRWLLVDGLALGRLRDGAVDRDLLADVGDRPRTGRDRVVEDALIRSLMQVDAVPPDVRSMHVVEPIVDTAGRAGLELALRYDRAAESKLPATLHALASATDLGFCSIVTCGQLADRFVVRLWYAERPRVEQTRRWS